jgi:hypothetical protein
MSGHIPETEDWAELLRVEPTVIQQKVDFFEACAALYPERPAEPDRADRTGDPRASWAVLAQRATMLRQAGQFQMLVDLERSRSFLLEAALTYVKIGMPYGYFLFASFVSAHTPETIQVWADPWLEAMQGDDAREVSREEPPLGLEGFVVPGRPMRASAARHPVQQAYLSLALAGDPQAGIDTWYAAEDLAPLPPASASIPIGPQRSPIGEYRRCASLLEELRYETDRERLNAVQWELETLLIEHARHFEASIVAAWEDTYHWQALRVPIDVVDLDLAAKAALADAVLNQMGAGALEPLRGRLETLSSLARMPIELGIRLKRSDPRGPEGFGAGPTVPLQPSGLPGSTIQRAPMSWSTLAEYQAGDPRRQASQEVLFGSNWYTRPDLPPWRAAWVQATGEFIVVSLAGAHEADHGPVRLLGTFPDLGVLEIGLRAWPRMAGRAGSLAWLQRRVTGLITPA